jgi:hypothetical protein
MDTMNGRVSGLPLQSREPHQNVRRFLLWGPSYCLSVPLPNAPAQRSLKAVCLHPKRLSGFLGSVKDDLALKTPRVYSIPCECGNVYIGQTGRSIKTPSEPHISQIRRDSKLNLLIGALHMSEDEDEREVHIHISLLSSAFILHAKIVQNKLNHYTDGGLERDQCYLWK